MPLPTPTAENSVTLTTTDLTYPTVTAYIAQDGYEAGITSDGVVWRKILYYILDEDDVVAGHKADLLIDALKGFSQVDILTNWNLSKYRAPHRFPGNTYLACDEASKVHKGVAKPAVKLHETNFAAISASYRSLPYSITGGNVGTEGDPDFIADQTGTSTFGLGDDAIVMPFTTVRKTKGEKTYTINLPSLKSATDPDSSFTRGFQVQRPIFTYHLTYHKVPWMGNDFDNALYQSVNDASYAGFEAGTLRYGGSEAEPTGIGQGRMGYDVTVDVIWNPMGWNKEIPAGKVAGETVTFIDDDTKFPYQPADFSILSATLDPGP